ncbi:cation:dicarboxylate symporter family transporter [Sphingobacterium sp. E70]|uniref:cation:dicarboxylate symporter family transporter n=1 Tax=Sphingobacterium sp. E70 TaxID=2853439 RepID=UPI002795AA87|nr:cation:dicarboxylase symporter family transporter [Sphingobacterium sp. E70]
MTYLFIRQQARYLSQFFHYRGNTDEFFKRRTRFLNVLDQGQQLFYTFIKYLYFILPLIILCNIAYGVAVYGVDTLLPLSKVVATVYLADIVFIVVVLG